MVQKEHYDGGYPYVSAKNEWEEEGVLFLFDGYIDTWVSREIGWGCNDGWVGGQMSGWVDG